jgi:hypothetical protein
MKKLIAVLLMLCLLSGCAAPTPQQPDDPTPPDQGQTDNNPSNQEQTAPQHSPLYLPDFDADQIITYFNEICLDAEISNSGNPNLLQKWAIPIYYRLHGDYTDQDLSVLTSFVAWLNTMEGFPGMYEAPSEMLPNLNIHFCTPNEMAALMGDWTYGLDGAVTFWYNENAIYDAVICYRSDIDQSIRNSVILEEIYNGLGPVQDTDLRCDSIIYSGYSTPQSLTAVDELLLRILYQPQLTCGMNIQQCEAVIRQLYY